MLPKDGVSFRNDAHGPVLLLRFVSRLAGWSLLRGAGIPEPMASGSRGFYHPHVVFPALALGLID